MSTKYILILFSNNCFKNIKMFLKIKFKEVVSYKLLLRQYYCIYQNYTYANSFDIIIINNNSIRYDLSLVKSLVVSIIHVSYNIFTT